MVVNATGVLKSYNEYFHLKVHPKKLKIPVSVGSQFPSDISARVVHPDASLLSHNKLPSYTQVLILDIYGQHLKN